MIVKPNQWACIASLAIFVAFYVITIVFTVMYALSAKDVSVNKLYFSFITGAHGFIVLLVIILLHVQRLFLISAKVQGYTYFYKRLSQFLNMQQYVYTIFSACVMVLLILTQVPQFDRKSNFVGSIIQNDFYAFFALVSFELLIIISISITYFYFQHSYIRNSPLPDSTSLLQQSDSCTSITQQEIIQKMHKHLKQLSDLNETLTEQSQKCEKMQTAPEFEFIMNENKKLMLIQNELKNKLEDLNRDLKGAQGEKAYLEGVVQGLKRTLG
ncbi:TMEM192_family [Hexamita inflata]|uniref:TMEM192_family n=1 Tax=Hexamita inflata TaxID=28002 RepID=A0ABP1J4K6_9EUKA